jgi:high-affinity iron transporter
VADARGRYGGELAAGIRRADARADADARRALAAAARAARAGDDTRLAAARGALRAALFRGSFAATLAAVERGDAAAARDWLLLREFRTATRFTRPGADATVALRRLQARGLGAGAARAAVAKDLLDAY